jgi:hypothetical protein
VSILNPPGKVLEFRRVSDWSNADEIESRIGSSLLYRSRDLSRSKQRGSNHKWNDSTIVGNAQKYRQQLQSSQKRREAD